MRLILAALAAPCLALAWFAAVWLLPGVYQAAWTTQGLRPARSLCAVGLFVGFWGSILLVL